MDCRRSGVNSLAVQSNRIMLPFPRDVVQDGLVLRATAAAAGKCADLEALVLDVRDAFYQLPLLPAERPYAVAGHTGPDGVLRYYAFL
eukprot:4495550-Amphidinium_carterae.1